MKYKDYLIIPIIAMYIVLTSFAFVGKNNDGSGDGEAPMPSICPDSITMGDDVWYADGARNSDSFCLGTVHNISIDDMHLICATEDGKRYDLIFVDSMTAYDCCSDTYYQRADYDTLEAELESGRFINSKNYLDYYCFKTRGRSVECFGEKVYRGKWSLDTSNSLTVYDNTCGGYMRFEILFDSYGHIKGISYNNCIYNLVT